MSELVLVEREGPIAVVLLNRPDALNALSDELKEQIVQAYLDIDELALLDLLRADGYERVEPEDYDYVEEQATELDLLTAQ